MEHSNRHRRVWGICRLIAGILAFLKLNFSAPVNDIDGTCIVLCNHVTNWDPIMIGSVFKKQMYFVASENVYRMGFLSRLLRFFIAPIPRQKGGNAAGTVKTILRTLKAGLNVCIFPEGNRSWDGRTGDFPPSTGKLVKAAGVSLVTYRLSGGYFSSPRWAGKALRKGRVTGRVIGVYKPEELKTMSVAEINRIISRDIYEDAYEVQRSSPVAYKGTSLAEHMETLLFACPVCGTLHSLQSTGSILRCSACGSKAEYLETGFLKGSMGFETVQQWSDWQQGLIASLCEKAGASAIFRDSGVELCIVESGKSDLFISNGDMLLFRDRIELPGKVILPADLIAGMAIFEDAVLFIGAKDGANYQLRSPKTINMYKYLVAAKCLGFIDSFV